MDQFIIFLGSHPVLSLAWGAIALVIIFLTIKIKMSPVKQLSTQELTLQVNRENGIVLDIRSDADFKKSHIVDAKHLNPEKVTAKDFASIETHKDSPIIVVCTAGISAQKVATDLLSAGFTRVNLLKGGMNAWVGAGLPVTKK